MSEQLGFGGEYLPLHVVRPAGLAGYLAALAPGQAAFLRAQNFTAAAGSLSLLGGEAGLAGAVVGIGDDCSPSVFGQLAYGLPAGTGWRFAPGDFDGEVAAVGFLLGAYVYDRLKPRKRTPAILAPESIPARAALLADAVNFARDLINMPANLLGPSELAAAAGAVAGQFGAAFERVAGAALAERFPIVAAVGAGSERAPEAVIMSWAGAAATEASPLISLCGKGVCFDTGGYDIKPSGAMLRMKKDMGGAAIMLALARLIMACDLPVRLKLRIGCVENSISGHAMRPSDILTTVQGKTVEVGNTDAEGRLVLCDLLAEAAAESPRWLIDAATLTGAARVALGPDLPALFCNDDVMANMILQAGIAVHDQLWRLPLWPGYDSWLDSKFADMNTISSRPHAGSIVAALFLQRFVTPGTSWAHIDVYCWNDQQAPGRPEGGEAQSLRALFCAAENLSRLSA